MTFKDLRNLIQQEESQQEQNPKLDILKNLPFYFELELENEHNEIDNCCFNHAIGLPTKHGIELPLFDYEKNILDILKDKKHLWILKSTGLGITELFLRYMAWLCLRNNDYQNSQMVIVTGPNIDLAIKLIRRMKNLFFEKLDITFDSKETVLILNKCTIEAYPSNHIDSFRSLENPRFILLDECDFFRKDQQQEVRSVAERYIGKSNPFIIMISTPNAPNGLMQTIENEPADTCLYHRIKLDYRYGLNKIYSIPEIEEAKKSYSFDREYDLKYLGKIGNVYSQLSIDKAIEKKGRQLGLDYNEYTVKFMTIDEGYSSSKFAILVAENLLKHENVIRILHAEEISNTSYEKGIERIFELVDKFGNVKNIGFDASRPELGISLKNRIGERSDLEYTKERMEYCKKHNLNLADYMGIVPIVFNTENRSFMTSHSRNILDNELVAIDPTFTELITGLRAAQFDDSGKLLKDESPHDDLVDTFQMLLSLFRFKNINE